MEVILDIASRAVVLDFGCKIAEGTPAEVVENPRVVQAYLGEGDELDAATQ
jgi:branched-chain amino acid transport system ATP-binding protein